MSGHAVYTIKKEKDSIVIDALEGGKPMYDREGLVGWSWSDTPSNREVADVAWETLKEATAKRGDLRATFIDERKKDMMRDYRKPEGARIGRGEETESLYAKEHVTQDAFKASAEELGKVLGLKDFFHEVLPEALLSFLESYDNTAVLLAVEKWLLVHKDLKPATPAAEVKTMVTRTIAGETLEVPVADLRVPDIYSAAGHAEKAFMLAETLRRGFDKDIINDGDKNFDPSVAYDDDETLLKLQNKMEESDGSPYLYGVQSRALFLETWHLAHDLVKHLQVFGGTSATCVDCGKPFTKRESSTLCDAHKKIAKFEKAPGEKHPSVGVRPDGTKIDFAAPTRRSPKKKKNKK